MLGRQKALVLQSSHGSFIIVDRDVPKPGKGQLLVRVEAVALNPIDWKVREYGLYLHPSQYPAVLGDGISDFNIGDRVVFPASWLDGNGAFQQYTLADAPITAKVPEYLSFEEASTMPVALGAAMVGLYSPKPYGCGFIAPLEESTRGKSLGLPIVILGGATSVGQFAIQLAKLSGFSPIITTASLKHSEYLESLGATHVVDRNLPSSELTERIGEITSASIEVIYDAVSTAETQKLGYKLLAEGGQLVVVLDPAVHQVKGKGIRSVAGVFTLPHTRDLGVQLYSTLHELLVLGFLKPNRLEILSGGLRGIVKGLERLKADQVSGVKLISRPQETVEISSEDTSLTF